MKKDYPIIGIAGSNGSGKDTLAELLAEKYGFFFGNATDMLGSELERRGKDKTRLNKSALSAEWRKKYGMSAIVDRAVEEYEAHHSDLRGVAVGSLRHPGEAEKVKELGGVLVWIDADPKVRYERVHSVNREGREEEDKLDYETWLADEQREMTYVGNDKTTLNVAAVKELRDVEVINNGSDLNVFRQKAEEALSSYLEQFS